MKKTTIILCLFLIAISSSLTGCGRKRAPVPPGTLRPERIKDLSYEIVKDGVVLSWSVPRRNHDGSPLSRIQEFHLFKAETPLESSCPECPPKYGKPIVIKYDKKPEPGKKIVYEDTTVQKGFYYTYQVKTVKGLFNVSDFSNKISFAWHSPPKAPVNLSAKVLEEGVELSWLAPEAFEDGEALDHPLSYRIYRRFGDEEQWQPLPGTTDKTSYFDKIRRTYRTVGYKVAAIFEYLGTEIEGTKSPPVTVKARGLQEIPAPKKVSVVKTRDGMLLRWSLVRRPGIIGYYVFRKDPDGMVVQLNSSPMATSTFLDRTILEPGRYFYWVTSIDDSYPPNQSRPSKAVSIVVE